MYESVEAIVSTVNNKNQSIGYKVSENLPPVMVDQDMIRRVVTNLLENASKYSPAGCNIEVGSQRQADMLAIWVQDHGPGIPASEHERIFDKFTRLKTENGPKGLGIGLAYCRLAVQAHGGRIWVESELGRGSSFIFTLPKKPHKKKLGEILLEDKTVTPDQLAQALRKQNEQTP